MTDQPKARAEPLIDHPLVTAIARELFDDVANDEHGQLCPIWTRRKDHPAWTECDCFVLRRVRRHAEIALAAPAVRAALAPPSESREALIYRLRAIADEHDKRARHGICDDIGPKFIAALSQPVPEPDVERLVAALIDLFPAGQRARWPFSVEEMAAALAARLASSEPTP